jgi:hypothetical protein
LRLKARLGGGVRFSCADGYLNRAARPPCDLDRAMIYCMLAIILGVACCVVFLNPTPREKP